MLLAFLFSMTAQAALPAIVEAEDRRQITADVFAKDAGALSMSTRERAALAYGRLQTPRSIDPLLKLLKDSKPRVRAMAAFSIGQLGWSADFTDKREADLQNALVAALSDKDLNVRVRIVEALGKVGLLATPDLVTPALSAKEPEVRAEALLALYRARLVLKVREADKDLKDLPQTIFDRLGALSDDKDNRVRRNVAYYFSRVDDPRGEKLAAKLSHDADVWTRTYALTGLAKMKAKNSKADILTALSDREESVRVAAVGALTASGESVGLSPTLKTDSSFQVRMAFASGLKGDQPAEASLLQSILETDGSFAVRAEALKALAKGHKEDLNTWLTPYLKNSNALLRQAAVEASDGLSPEAREKFLDSPLKDSDPNVRGAALEAIGSIPSATAYGILQTALGSSAVIERGTAVAAMKDRTETDIPERVWRAYNASLDHQWVEVRQDMVDVFAKTVNDTTSGYLRQMVSDPDPSVSAKARRALLARGSLEIPATTQAALSLSPYRENTFKKNPVVVFQTSKGSFTVETFPKDAQIHVASFIGLVKKGAYDNLTWHRVVPNFVLQGGDPDGTGWGDAGYFLRAEINTIRFDRGTLGMPRASGFDTGGSQLFFTLIPAPHLDGQYTVFGQVTKGLDVLTKLERGDRIIKASLQ